MYTIQVLESIGTAVELFRLSFVDKAYLMHLLYIEKYAIMDILIQR